MGELEEFLDSALPRLTEADTAFHNGDSIPRIAMWSSNEPVTVFGAAQSRSGWADIAPMFSTVASRFSKCESFEYEVIAADVSGDLAYIVGIEHTTAAVDDGAPIAYSLRVTTIFRREDGEWKVVHRHADPLPESESSQLQIARLKKDPGSPAW